MNKICNKKQQHLYHGIWSLGNLTWKRVFVSLSGAQISEYPLKTNIGSVKSPTRISMQSFSPYFVSQKNQLRHGFFLSDENPAGLHLSFVKKLLIKPIFTVSFSVYFSGMTLTFNHRSFQFEKLLKTKYQVRSFNLWFSKYNIFYIKVHHNFSYFWKMKYCLDWLKNIK